MGPAHLFVGDKEVRLAARAVAARKSGGIPSTVHMIPAAVQLNEDPVVELSAAGTGFDKVLKTTCFLADMGDFAAFNEVYARYFTSRPARSCVAVKELPKGVLCEIEAIAVK